MSNLDLWNKVNKPPVSALKTIGGGRLKGMTDVNPQWRLQALTEQFGQIGVGWSYEITDKWTEKGVGEAVMAFVQINLYTMSDGIRSMPIPGLGGSALVAKESNGYYSNDEAYKMALTDALSVAMKQLGVASAIYEGLWDGSKYREVPQDQEISDIKEAIKQINATKNIRELLNLWPKTMEKVRSQQAFEDAFTEKRSLFSVYECIALARTAQELDSFKRWLVLDEEQQDYFNEIYDKLKTAI